MASKKKCGATIENTDRELKCVLPAGHDGPVHEDKKGDQWGDITLPAPHHRDERSTE